jgi:hypothetical protein
MKAFSQDTRRAKVARALREKESGWRPHFLVGLFYFVAA